MIETLPPEAELNVNTGIPELEQIPGGLNETAERDFADIVAFEELVDELEGTTTAERKEELSATTMRKPYTSDDSPEKYHQIV